MSDQKILTLEALRLRYKPISLAKAPSWPFPFSTVQQITKRQIDASTGKTSYLVKFKEGSTTQVASEVLKKTNATLVNKYEKAKTSQLEDSTDEEEDQKKETQTFEPIKKRILVPLSDSESEADDELDEAEYLNSADNSEAESSGDAEDKYMSDGSAVDYGEGRSSGHSRKKPRIYYGAPSIEDYQKIDDEDERTLVKKKRDKYLMSFCYRVPLYIDEQFIENHDDSCYVCFKGGDPNGANDDLMNVTTGSMARKRRLLLCKTCTLSCHNSCLPTTADKCFDKQGNYVCTKCRSTTIAKCNICKSLTKEEPLLFRCSICFRSLHKKCRTPTEDECYTHYNHCYECHTYTYKNTTSEKVLAQKSVDGKRMLLIKWKNLSYRHVDWVCINWFEQAHKTMYRSYLLKASNGDIPSGSAGAALEEWKQIDRILSIEWEEKAKEKAKRVFAVYKDTSYEEAVWDDPPTEKEPALFKAYNIALKRYIIASKVTPPEKIRGLVKSVRDMATKEDYSKHEYKTQPSFIKGGQLMPHQMEALNFLLYKWETEQSCILADDMGLGKTIQIISFLSVLFKKYNIYPFLLCVPNSTATNWVREFEKWAPDMVIVPFWGGQKSQSLSIKHELFKEHGGKKVLKCHVVVTTYQSVMDTSPLMHQFFPVLIIDESQRLKNDNSLLFKKLQQYKVDHTVLLTGTPLQNNLRELFNIMHFIQPKLFQGIDAEDYDEMSSELVEDLHNRLRPFFLRRTKEEVLKQLPPKYEIIVPLSMTPVQKEAYKSALGKNIYELLSDMQVSNSKRQRGLSSVLVNLRKILNHPYLIDGVEVPQPNEESTIREMIAACEKLKVFHIMLPKLRAKGHRMLIFSTMTRSLDVLEDYLTYEDVRYCRLDGKCSERDRVRSMDAFNAPNSEIDVFLLSTRAGGVGINLATADTVIFWDSDYNPYADAQAIGRAHRIGQTKMVLTFRFMTRLSVEEKILQIGKKKMALEHVVVERMAQEENKVEDIQSILKYGAKNLFDNDDSTDIHYDEKKIDALIEREQYRNIAEEQKQKEIDDVEKHGEEGMNFSFAKVWKSNGDTEEIEVSGKEEENDDFWTKFLAEKQEEAQKKKKQKEIEASNMGRGLRKRKKPGNYYEKGQKNHNSGSSLDDDFKLDENHQESMSEDSDNGRGSMIDEVERGMRNLYSSNNGDGKLLGNLLNGTATMQNPNGHNFGLQNTQLFRTPRKAFTLPAITNAPLFNLTGNDTINLEALPPAEKLEREKKLASDFEKSFTDPSIRSPGLYYFATSKKINNRGVLIQEELKKFKDEQDRSYLPLLQPTQSIRDMKGRHKTILNNLKLASKDVLELQRRHDQALLRSMEEIAQPISAVRKHTNSLPQAPPQAPLEAPTVGYSNGNKQAPVLKINQKKQLTLQFKQQMPQFVSPQSQPQLPQQPPQQRPQLPQQYQMSQLRQWFIQQRPQQYPQSTAPHDPKDPVYFDSLNQQQNQSHFISQPPSTQQQLQGLIARQQMAVQNNSDRNPMFYHIHYNSNDQLKYQQQQQLQHQQHQDMQHQNGNSLHADQETAVRQNLQIQLANQINELRQHHGISASRPPPGQYENIELLQYHVHKNNIVLQQLHLQKDQHNFTIHHQPQLNNIRPPPYLQQEQNNASQNGNYPTK